VTRWSVPEALCKGSRRGVRGARGRRRRERLRRGRSAGGPRPARRV